MKTAFRSLLIFLLSYTQAFAGSPMIWGGTRAKNLTTYGVQLSDGSALDNDGTLNYIKNGHAEVNITGWSTYDDGAVAAPVNCTAGTVTETVTRSTSSPLIATASVLLTKDAADRQGEGISYDFTIDSAFVSQPLQIAFSGSGSASLAASDLGVYIYDVTNATVISPSTVNLPASNTQYVATWNATTSTSYRLCVHTQSTNAAAYTYKLDQVKVGVLNLVQGAAIGDMVSFTPTVAGFGTSPTTTGWWRRVGDSMEGEVFVRVTNTAGATTQTFNMPTGYTVDTTKIATQAAVAGDGGVQGAAYVVNTSTGAGYTGLLTVSSNVFSIYGSNGAAAWNSTVPAAISTNSTYRFTFTVPISTWSSNTTLATSRVEFASNSSSTDANDTTSFAYGPAGSQFALYTSNRTKVVRFQTPIQPTDSITVEVTQDSGVTWNSVGQSTEIFQAYVLQNTTEYGINILPLNSTDIYVKFYQYRLTGGATYAAAGNTWAGINATNTYKWRVRKSSGIGAGEVAPVVPNATTGSSGYVDGVNGLKGFSDASSATSGYVGEVLTQTRVRSASTALTTATTLNVTATPLTLTAGDWDIFATFCTDPAVATSITNYSYGISTTSATMPGNDVLGVSTSGQLKGEWAQGAATTNGERCFTVGPAYARISSSTIYYLVANCTFTVSTLVGHGSIIARRVR